MNRNCRSGDALCWRACSCSRRQRERLSHRSGRSCCCNPSIAASWSSTTSPATCVSNWTSARRASRRTWFRSSWVRRGLSVRPSRQSSTSYVPTYADRPPPDLIMTIAGPAAVFARKYRAQLFPDTPLLFASVDYDFCRARPWARTKRPFRSSNNYPGLVDDILQVLPKTRQVFMVLGSGMLNRFWRPQLENRIQALSRSRDVHLVRRSVFLGSPATAVPHLPE